MHRSLSLIAAAGLLVTAGCQNKCCLNDPDKRPPRTYPPPPGGAILLPPANLPTTPGGTVPAGAMVPSVAPGGPTGPAPFNPAPIAPQSPSLKPAPEVLYPDPIPSVPSVPGGPSSRSVGPNTPANGVLQRPTKPTPANDPSMTAAVMTGLPAFAKVKEGLASGRKPELDGFTTLKQAGYKTVIYLYPAGADVAALREVAGTRGLGFNSIETTPEGLGKALGAFTGAISDKADRPAYVCDGDGVRAGALWYLYFRTVEFRNDDEARLLAKPLGLTSEGKDAQAFEVAIQQYLANQ